GLWSGTRGALEAAASTRVLWSGPTDSASSKTAKERMRGMTRKLAALTALCLTAALVGLPATHGAAPTHISIMVGGLNKQIYLPNMLTQQLGYFTEQGLNVTLIDEASGQSSENEVLAGQVQAGSGSYNHTIQLQVLGKAMMSVVQLTIAPGEAE